MSSPIRVSRPRMEAETPHGAQSRARKKPGRSPEVLRGTSETFTGGLGMAGDPKRH